MAPSTPTGNPAAPAVGSGCSSGNRPRDTIHRCEASHGMKATALHSDKYLESRAALSLQADGVKRLIRCAVRRCEAMKRTPIGGASCASYRRRHQPAFFGKLARRVRTGDTTPFVRTPQAFPHELVRLAVSRKRAETVQAGSASSAATACYVDL